MPFGLHTARCDWPVKPKFPLIPGHEGLGIVKEIGKDMTEVNEEDRVAGDTNVFAEPTKERFLSS
jgi:D-arabinose 1-dehydrogenase-like Zn-dependent alcohol dehydrogenase